MPRLGVNWRAVLRYAWSIRLMALAGCLSGVEAALPLVDGRLGIPPGLAALAAGIVTAAAFVARLLAQANLPEEVR